MKDIPDRTLFGIMLVGAYVLSLGTLAFIPIPPENSEYFGQLMIGLVGAIGVIVGAVWKTSAREDEANAADREAFKTLADKVPPPTGEAAEIIKDEFVIGNELAPEERIEP